MSMWTIEVTYQTGNSFNTEICTDNINLAWKNLDLAKQCLQSIKEHYLLYTEISESSYRRQRTNDEIMADMKSRAWCVEDATGWVNNVPMSAICDDGEMRRVSTYMWCGHFEKLESAEIISIGESDMKLVF